MNNPFEVIEERLSTIETLLLDLNLKRKEQSKQPEADELLTVDDAATFLHLSKPTIYGLIHKGAIPVMKRSKRCYFLKNELLEYLKKGKRQTIAEIANEASNYLNKKGGTNV